MTFFLLIGTSVANGQGKKQVLKMGIYGSYADYSTFSELTIFDNQTFCYHDQSKYGINIEEKGKWKIKDGFLILSGVKNNKFRPTPTKWGITNNELCAIFKKGFEISKDHQLCFRWDREK